MLVWGGVDFEGTTRFLHLGIYTEIQYCQLAKCEWKDGLVELLASNASTKSN